MSSAFKHLARRRTIATLAGTLISALCLGGCGNVVEVAAFPNLRVEGLVHSAGHPIAGAKITVFAAGQAGFKSKAQTLSDVTLVSDENGAFSIKNLSGCANPANMIYVVAEGGTVQGWNRNAGIGLLAVLGACSSPASTSHVDVNEQSTVAAAWPLAPYAANAGQIGFEDSALEQQTLSNIERLQAGISQSEDNRAVRTLNAAANALSSCVQSSGGTSGDGTACGSLFALAASAGHPAPDNTLTAMFTLAQQAAQPLPQLYRLSTSQQQFHPALSYAPKSWELADERDDRAGGDPDNTDASSDPDNSASSTSAPPQKRVVTIVLTPKNTSVGSSMTATIKLEKARKVPVTFQINISAPGVLSVETREVTLNPGQVAHPLTLKGLSAGTASIELQGKGYKSATADVQVWTTIPSTFFGMTVKDYNGVNPTVSFGTTRSWDAGDESSTDDLSWSSLNPASGTYDFDRLDRFIAVNQARNAEMIYTFGRTPQWASSQPHRSTPYGPGQCAPPADLAVWDAYVSAIVKHAGGRIRYWELWNEPNSQDFYCGDMPTLVTMAQHAYRIIKEIDPGATVLSPAMTSSAGPSWLGYFLWLGGNKYVDVIAFHGYSSVQAEDIQSVVTQYRIVATANGVGNLPFWDTEASWAGNGDLPTPAMSSQTAFLAKYFLLQRSLGIHRFVWYAYDGGNTWGGLWSQGNGASQAATAYAAVYSWMVGQVLTHPCSLSASDLWLCGLTDPATGAEAYVVWSPDFTQHLGFQGSNVLVENLAHERHTVSHGMDIGAQPMLLRGTESLPVVVGVQ